MEQIASSISKFNEEVEETILACCSASSPEEYAKEKTNLEKYVDTLNKKLANLTDFSEARFQEMRGRTEAYFKEYVEVEEGGWRVVVPSEEAK